MRARARDAHVRAADISAGSNPRAASGSPMMTTPSSSLAFASTAADIFSSRTTACFSHLATDSRTFVGSFSPFMDRSSNALASSAAATRARALAAVLSFGHGGSGTFASSPSTHTLAANALAASSTDVCEVASNAAMRWSSAILSASARHRCRRCRESITLPSSPSGRVIPGMFSASRPGPESARNARPPPEASPTPTLFSS
mmetsp:Transcript_9584/g.43657  ORF Transcript_9584/g.43657 Transcript_9584/m.43657 type:complete len:202 (-) Transcript_9584:188-793(-)